MFDVNVNSRERYPVLLKCESIWYQLTALDTHLHLSQYP